MAPASTKRVPAIRYGGMSSTATLIARYVMPQKTYTQKKASAIFHRGARDTEPFRGGPTKIFAGTNQTLQINNSGGWPVPSPLTGFSDPQEGRMVVACDRHDDPFVDA